MKNRQIWLKNRQMWLKKILKNKVQDGTIIHTASEIIIQDIVILIILYFKLFYTENKFINLFKFLPLMQLNHQYLQNQDIQVAEVFLIYSNLHLDNAKI